MLPTYQKRKIDETTFEGDEFNNVHANNEFESYFMGHG